MSDRAAPPATGQRQRELFFSLVGRHLAALDHVLRHEIAYLESVGTLLPRELRPEEVVDATLVRACREFVERPPEGKIKRWLLALAKQQLAAEVARLKGWRDRTPVRLEHDVPETPPTEQVSRLGEEILDFHEPDEDLKVEDVLPDLEAPSPEEEIARQEMRWCVSAALAGMPEEWRRLLLLRHVEGLGGAALARAAGKSPADVRRILGHAIPYLRQRLLESGCRFKAA
jgi:RNA polymerase sigma factor (sigma-70 family)